MMPPEKPFVRRRRELSIHIFECIWTVHLCYDIHGSFSSRVMSLAGDLRPDVFTDQQIIETWTYDTPTGQQTLNITMGYTGADSQIFITITTSDGFSERFLDTGDSFPVRPVLIREVKRLNHIA